MDNRPIQAVVGVIAAKAINVAALRGIGFGVQGVSAGSIAAYIQSILGNVKAGSLFAKLTSAGMTGSFLVPIVATAAALAVVAVVVYVASFC